MIGNIDVVEKTISSIFVLLLSFLSLLIINSFFIVIFIINIKNVKDIRIQIFMINEITFLSNYSIYCYCYFLDFNKCEDIEKFIKRLTSDNIYNVLLPLILLINLILDMTNNNMLALVDAIVICTICNICILKTKRDVEFLLERSTIYTEINRSTNV